MHSPVSFERDRVGKFVSLRGVNAGSQDAEVEITVMILEFILGIKVVKLQMRNEAILRKLHKSLHKLQQTQKTVKN